MIRPFVLAVGTLIAISASASAADLPSARAPVPFVPPPAFTWTGLYVGAQVGYLFGTSSFSAGFTDGGSSFNQSNPSGVIGGGHVGYNFALPGFGAGIGNGLILGIEGDIDGSGYNGHTAFGGADPNFVGSTTSLRDSVQGSVRGRLGFSVDRALFYATGGAAFAEFVGGINNPAVGFQNFNVGRVGYTVGGGVEYALSANFSVRAEYRYSDFGSFGLVVAGPVGGLASVRETEQRAQLGISYRFLDAVAPVVARY